MACNERARVPFTPALLIADLILVMRTALLSGNTVASASSAVATSPITDVETVRIGRVPSLISTTRTP